MSPMNFTCPVCRSQPEVPCVAPFPPHVERIALAAKHSTRPPAPSAAEQAQPVGCVHVDTLAMLKDLRPIDGGAKIWPISKSKFDTAYVPLYTTPVPEQAQPAGVTEDARDAAITDEQIDAAIESWYRNDLNSDRTRMRAAIDAARAQEGEKP